jgi:hypothetical protein
MTSTIPGIIAWPVITFMVILLAARFRWCRANLYDTYFNNVMAWLMLAQLLRERDVEVVLSRGALMTATTAQQLACAAMDLACVELIGFTLLWTGLSPVETRRRHRYYRLAAVVLCVAFLAAATRARVAGQTLEVSGGWDAVLAFGFYLTTIGVVLARSTWMFTSELRKATDNREFLLSAAGMLFAVVTAAACLEAPVLAVTDQLGWTHTVEFRLWLHSSEFFWLAVVAYLLGAVPLAVRLHAYLGLDRISRTWTRLQPLRLSMTAVVPESRFDLGHDDRRFQKTTLQLHQTIIEIRDAILQLRPYVRDTAPHERARLLKAYSVPTYERGAATQAFELAHAARAKIAGATPEPPDMTPIVRTRSTTLNEEAAELLALAKWWTPAYAATEQFTPMSREVKASRPA